MSNTEMSNSAASDDLGYTSELSVPGISFWAYKFMYPVGNSSHLLSCSFEVQCIAIFGGGTKPFTPTLDTPLKVISRIARDLFKMRLFVATDFNEMPS